MKITRPVCGKWRDNMDKRKAAASGTTGGVIWFIGWLFTISFAQLVGWKIVLGIVAWPFLLGQALR